MTNKDWILKITDRNAKERIGKIASCIDTAHEFQTVRPGGKFPTSAGITNIIVPAKVQKDKIALIAHHDVYPESCGYNDNSTGVVTLLKLQKCLPDNVELVFTDGEERGGQGCRYYLENSPRPARAINIDVVGLAGKIFYEAYGPYFCSFKVPKSLEYYDYIPFSDSYILADYGVPNILLITGRSVGTLIRDIFDAQHNGKNDHAIDLISEDMMDRVFDALVGMLES